MTRAWSVVSIAHAMRACPRWLQGIGGRLTTRRKLAHSSSQGQAAVMFIVLMGLILILAAATMNLGEVARLKTATANAADAGALAAASWVASGQNTVAEIAKMMWINVLIVQLVFVLPFCIQAVWVPVLMAFTLFMANYMNLKLNAADAALEAAWENAAGAALFTAIQNTGIDDPSGTVQAQVKALSDQYAANRTVPSSVRFDWVRKGARGVPEPSWVQIDVAFSGSQPSMDTLNFGPPIPVVWSPPIIPWCAWATVGWGGSTQKPVPLQSSHDLNWVGMSTSPPAWFPLGGIINIPLPGFCLTCFPIPVPVVSNGTTPDSINEGEGDVTVTVTRSRAGGSPLRFWTTSYPGQVLSQATAHYNEASVGFPPSSDAFAELQSVR